MKSCIWTLPQKPVFGRYIPIHTHFCSLIYTEVPLAGFALLGCLALLASYPLAPENAGKLKRRQCPWPEPFSSYQTLLTCSSATLCSGWSGADSNVVGSRRASIQEQQGRAGVKPPFPAQAMRRKNSYNFSQVGCV